MDLLEFPEGLDAVNTIRALLLADPAHTRECALAWILRHGPVDRLRSLEYESGLGLYQVWKLTSPLEGGTSPLGLVETIERGKSWDSEGREKGSYRLGESVHVEYTKNFFSKYSQTFPSKNSWRVKDLDAYRVLETHGYSAEGTQHDPAVWNEDAPLLWPGLDAWTRGQLGLEGWRVIMLTFPIWEGSAKEWADLVGKDSSTARRMAQKLEKRMVLAKTGKARATRYRLDWTLEAGIVESMTEGTDFNRAHESADDYQRPHGMDTGSRAHKVLDRHGLEMTRIQRPLTYEEIEIRRRSSKKNRALWAKQYFGASMEAETEGHKAALAKLGHMYAGATEADWRRWMDAGRPLSEDEVRELAGLPPKPQEPVRTPSPQELAAMTRRVAREPKPIKVKELPLPVVPLDETEDDRVLRTVCQGDPALFETVHGRLPNQERIPGPRNRRHRQRVRTPAK
ncbi:hypothetical protein OG824_04085 [Streptomyces prunicolor]|uniref:hypothetical protein n=1 Tax=Streptomyces prunicolor TaxID=67348 RepID=UPI002259D83F|nr:hypothetical protein [Streptomyces prunicolor]MCX5234412.1 hypothetical protein [Streptomyces prunicolor]